MIIALQYYAVFAHETLYPFLSANKNSMQPYGHVLYTQKQPIATKQQVAMIMMSLRKKNKGKKFKLVVLC